MAFSLEIDPAIHQALLLGCQRRALIIKCEHWTLNIYFSKLISNLYPRHQVLIDDQTVFFMKQELDVPALYADYYAIYSHRQLKKAQSRAV